MAPMKRSSFDVDGEIIGVERASSSLRQDGQRKKARISINEGASSKSRQSSPSSSSDEDEQLPDVDQDGPLPPPATQYEMLRDGNFEHLKNTEADDKLTSKKFLARRKQIGENHAADNAIIETITCINFMCHDKLHVELGPLINFVVGLNGSGKSAVLTAITLCLGGKAASTNRGSSLKSLIKQGKEQALLIIKLKNQGNDGYQRDLYGDSIIIERHFAKNGSSGYKLKNSAGRLVSSKKGDVDDLIEYYQLQVDNPMNVLTQDAAKTFITASTPKMKYNFFKEGVQLEALDNDYKLVSDICDQMESKLLDSKDDLQALKKQAEDAATKAQLLQEHEGLKQKIRILQRQSAWCQVAAVETKLAEREALVNTAQENIEKKERVVEEKDTAFKRIDARLEEAKEAEAQLQEQLDPLKEEEEEAKGAHDATRKELEKYRTQRDGIKSNLRANTNMLKGVEADIAAEVKRMEDANGGAQARKLAEIKEAEQEVLNAQEAVTRSDEDGPRFEAKKASAQEALDKVDAAFGAKRRDVEAARQRLHELNQNQADDMNGYDPKMAPLISAIRNEQRFRERPVGPIGLHVKLLKPVWSHVIETVLGNNLNAFVVTSKSDLTLLQGILNRFKIKGCNVIIGNRQPINTSGHEPESHLDTILRVLDIDDDLVRNQLIINNGVDQTILIRKRSDASQTMFRGPKPKNVKSCLTLHDSRHDYGHRLTWGGRNQLEEMTPLELKMRRKPRMKSDNESQIIYQRDTLAQLEREKAQLETERAQAQANLKRCIQAISLRDRDHPNLKLVVQRAEDRVEKLQIELDNDNAKDGRLDGLETYLAEVKQNLTIDRDSYGSIVLEMEKLNQISLEKKRALDAVKIRVADHEAMMRKAHLKINNTSQARKITLEEKNLAITLVTDLQEEKAKAEQSRDSAIQKLKNYTEMASKVSLRVPLDEGETAESIAARLESLIQRLEQARRKQGASDQEIYQAALESESNFKRAMAQRIESEELLSHLKQSFMMRITMFQRFQRYISSRSRINFNYLLSERAFRGKLTIDHIAKKLDVHVEPDETNISGKGRQTKTLSGGEKSFSSICLLLSLWEAMGAPLRCLDEFDVFMDDVNRDVSTNMIITAARRSVGRQFILITPKALGAGAVDANAADVTIIKLYDPREKQRRIPDMMEEDE
ncbi:Structural maintenance of chromosomes protein [Lachnellula hyalina]|uniref:Structural maintenance of chromosomes protein n=1 Tax=Lachnellula hyalina TaxID=1316788 RepID=A0A8H8R0R5_9HELO|nr:Structural maintenance of chromosomes protein [Lachnellula hyalina]TVY26432.1 Structural maintenance of chromosomes protein [Lachnellula hyalina]